MTQGNGNNRINRYSATYLAGYAILLAVMVTLLVTYPKADLHLMLNSRHTAFQDTFFRYYSVLAEWPLYVIALIPICFRKLRWTCFYALSEAVSALIIRVIKICCNMPRPLTYFTEQYPDVQLPLVDGVAMHHSASFPSGHSGTFFVFFTFCALLLAHQYMVRRSSEEPASAGKGFLRFLAVIGLLLAAAVGGYSRIYLSQHFLLDVCVGSLCGTFAACTVFALFYRKIVK